MTQPPHMAELDLYEVLGVSPSATDSEIKQAYRRRSLETHPDRFEAGSREQKETTVLFQEVNNAYYILSDPKRRGEYDSKRSSGDAGGGFKSWFRSAFPKDSSAKANEQFSSAFEEMMAEEGQKQHQHHEGIFYGAAGGSAGSVLGFIVANFPGAMIGALAGYRLGHIRDVKGKAVYEVFQELPHAQKTRVLAELLTHVAATVS